MSILNTNCAVRLFNAVTIITPLFHLPIAAIPSIGSIPVPPVKLFSLTTTPRRLGAECAHVTVFWPMKSCRQISPRDRSENNKRSYFHCTVKITKKKLFSLYSENNKKSYFHCTVKIMNAVILTVQ